MKRFLALLLAIVTGFLLVGCEEAGPRYYNRYFPLNTGNYWTYQVTSSRAPDPIKLYLVDCSVSALEESNNEIGDQWFINVKCPDSVMLDNYICPFPDHVRNNGATCYKCYYNPLVIPDDQIYRDFITDPMEKEDDKLWGLVHDIDWMDFSGYVDYNVIAGNFNDVIFKHYDGLHNFGSENYGSDWRYVDYSEYYAPDVGMIYSYYTESASEYDDPNFTYEVELVDYHINPR